MYILFVKDENFKPLEGNKGDDYFHYNNYSWNITKVIEWIKENQDKVELIDLEVQACSDFVRDFIIIKEENVEKVDLSYTYKGLYYDFRINNILLKDVDSYSSELSIKSVEGKKFFREEDKKSYIEGRKKHYSKYFKEAKPSVYSELSESSCINFDYDGIPLEGYVIK